MKKTRRIAVLTLLAAALVCAPSFGQTVLAGATPNGSFYTIAVPDNWNGGLVFHNHGLTLTPATPGPDLGPLLELQILSGYAVAASGYSLTGWAVFKTVEDLEQLYQVFVDNFGAPAFTILYGPSAGGAVTIHAVEQANLGNIIGAMPFCGAVGGSRNWELALDGRLVYDFLCQGVPGANIPGGAKGLPAGTTLTLADTVTAANACFGHDLPPSVRTPAQQARLNRLVGLLGIPQSFINSSLSFYAAFGMADLVHDPRKLGGRIGVGNKNVDYGAADVNAGIQRVTPRKVKRQKLKKYFTPTGDIGNTKILSLHTSGDGLVLVENQAMYAALAPPDLFSVAVVQEAVPTHCGFTTAELAAGWIAFTGWLNGDPQPSAFTLQVVCSAIQGPALPGPCRYNPFFQIPDPDGRFRPRNPGNAVRAASASAAVVPSAPSAAPPAGGPTAPSPAAAPSSPENAPVPAVESAPTRSPRGPLATDASQSAVEVESRLSKRLDREER